MVLNGHISGNVDLAKVRDGEDAIAGTRGRVRSPAPPRPHGGKYEAALRLHPAAMPAAFLASVGRGEPVDQGFETWIVSQ